MSRSYPDSPVNCVTKFEAERYCEMQGMRLPRDEEFGVLIELIRRLNGTGTAGERRRGEPGSMIPVVQLHGVLVQWTSTVPEPGATSLGAMSSSPLGVTRGISERQFSVNRWDPTRPGYVFTPPNFRGYDFADRGYPALGFRCASSPASAERRDSPAERADSPEPERNARGVALLGREAPVR